MGEQDRGFHAERIQVHYWCGSGHQLSPFFLATIEPEEIPEQLDCPNCGAPAGRDRENPPQVAKLEPYKTHLAYVKERRSEEEAIALLDEALTQLRARRGSAAS